MYNNNNYKREYKRDVQREVDIKPIYVTPKRMFTPTTELARICVYTSSFKDDRGVDMLAYQTSDFGFVCRVSSVYEPDEDGFITYDPIHALFNTKGSVPTLYILKSDRLKKLVEAQKEEEPSTDEEIIPLDDDMQKVIDDLF